MFIFKPVFEVDLSRRSNTIRIFIYTVDIDIARYFTIEIFIGVYLHYNRLTIMKNRECFKGSLGFFEHLLSKLIFKLSKECFRKGFNMLDYNNRIILFTACVFHQTKRVITYKSHVIFEFLLKPIKDEIFAKSCFERLVLFFHSFVSFEIKILE